MKYRKLLFAAGVPCGIFLALAYVNPYHGVITLSNLIFQLSGSRGDYAFLPAFHDIISLTIRMIPQFLFELLAGTELYRHFCTASVYIFSRTTNRLLWYVREVWILFCNTLLYQLIVTGTVLILTNLRYQVSIDSNGIQTVVFHVILNFLWTYSMTLLVNFLAVKWGSNSGFFGVCAAQICFLSLLFPLSTSNADSTYGTWSLFYNPISRLILEWQVGTANTGSDSLDILLRHTGSFYSLSSSALCFLLLSVLILISGAIFICQHDLLISDLETEGF
jgi:hypothetical protein